MKYIRYIDYFLIIGSLNDTKMVKNNIGKYLKQKFGVQFYVDKTEITNFIDYKSSFLGVDINIFSSKGKYTW
jgi:hypothetical protein